RHPLLEVAPHVRPDGRVRLRPLLSAATHPRRHKFADQPQPLRRTKAVVVQHPAVIEKQDEARRYGALEVIQVHRSDEFMCEGSSARSATSTPSNSYPK